MHWNSLRDLLCTTVEWFSESRHFRDPLLWSCWSIYNPLSHRISRTLHILFFTHVSQIVGSMTLKLLYSQNSTKKISRKQKRFVRITAFILASSTLLLIGSIYIIIVNLILRLQVCRSITVNEFSL